MRHKRKTSATPRALARGSRLHLEIWGQQFQPRENNSTNRGRDHTTFEHMQKLRKIFEVEGQVITSTGRVTPVPSMGKSSGIYARGEI